jgi:hypothetical protein
MEYYFHILLLISEILDLHGHEAPNVISTKTAFTAERIKTIDAEKQQHSVSRGESIESAAPLSCSHKFCVCAISHRFSDSRNIREEV